MQKAGKGIPGMPGRGNFVSKSLEAVKWWWVGKRAGFMMCLKGRVQGERRERKKEGPPPIGFEIDPWVCGPQVRGLPNKIFTHLQ